MIAGGEEAKSRGAPVFAGGVEVILRSRNDRTGVLMTLSSSSMVLCLYFRSCPSFRKSPSFVLRPEECRDGESSKIVSMGGPRLPEPLFVVLVGYESYTVSLW